MPLHIHLNFSAASNPIVTQPTSVSRKYILSLSTNELHYFSGLELFAFGQASDIWGLLQTHHQNKKVFFDVASSFSLLAACESMYYSIAFLKDTSVDTMYQEVFNAFKLCWSSMKLIRRSMRKHNIFVSF